MRKFLKLHTFLFFILLHCSLNGIAQKDSAKMVVGIAGSEPFIMDTSGSRGISAEIWEQLAGKMGWDYSTIYFGNMSDAINALKSGKVNAVAGPVSITAERAQYINFSLPYFQSSLSILSLREDQSVWSMISPFFSKEFFIAIFIFLIILALVGSLLWLAEKRVNPEQFPDNPRRGIANGMWCAIVTMTTTGYGDIAPRSFWGRFLAGIWMVVSLIFATTMIAGIAGTITLSGMKATSIRNAEDLRGKSVATKAGSPAADFIKEYRGKIIPVNTIEEGIEKLEDKTVDAVVYDRPQLLYLLQQKHNNDLKLSAAEYEKQGYGFAFPLSFHQLHEVNVALLELKEDDMIKRTITHWIGNEK